MIDVITGELTFDDTVIGSNFSRDDFIQSDLYNYVIRSESFLSQYSYLLKSRKIGEYFFIINIRFDGNGRLDLINLSMTDSEEIPSWKSWSLDKENYLKIKHDEWLGEILGQPPYKYEWGDISSLYEACSAVSIIVIKWYRKH